MNAFDKNWSNQNRVSAGDKLKETLATQGPLKPRLETASNKLQLQISKLDAIVTKLNERDASLFRRVVDAVQRHDTDTTRVLSNELAEVRKVSRTLGQAKMAFEQVSMRLSTIHNMGDIMVALGPAITSIKSLKPGLGRFVPGADSEINTMQTLLNGIMMESLQGGSSGIEINTGSGSDIDQIMMEASAVAEQKMNDKFPSIPTGSFRISDTASQQRCNLASYTFEYSYFAGAMASPTIISAVLIILASFVLLAMSPSVPLIIFSSSHVARYTTAAGVFSVYTPPPPFNSSFTTSPIRCTLR